MSGPRSAVSSSARLRPSSRRLRARPSLRSWSKARTRA
jgi:hypothetical protein